VLDSVNKIKLLGKEFPDSKLVEKIVTVLERYETFIAFLENEKDLSIVTLIEMIHFLQAQTQRRLMKENHVIEGVLNHTLDNALIVKNNRRSKYNNTSFYIFSLSQEKRSSTQMVLVEAKCKCHKCGQLRHWKRYENSKILKMLRL